MAIDFFKKYRWEPNEVDWHFLIIFDKQPQIKQLAEAYQPLLQHMGLYSPIPAEWLHMTLLRVGSTETISEQAMQSVCQLVKEGIANLTIPALKLESPWVWSGSVCLHVTPVEPLKDLFGIVTDATKEVLGKQAPDIEKFTPHVTLAYPRDTDDEQEIEEQLHQKKVKPMAFRPRELCLMKQRQTPPYYQWEVVTRIPLAR